MNDFADFFNNLNLEQNENKLDETLLDDIEKLKITKNTQICNHDEDDMHCMQSGENTSYMNVYYVLGDRLNPDEIVYQTNEDVFDFFEEMTNQYNCEIEYIDEYNGVYLGVKYIELTKIDNDIYQNILIDHQYKEPTFVEESKNHIKFKYYIFGTFRCIKCNNQIGDNNQQGYQQDFILQTYCENGRLTEEDITCDKCIE
jgi:hypothetical protein